MMAAPRGVMGGLRVSVGGERVSVPRFCGRAGVGVLVWCF